MKRIVLHCQTQKNINELKDRSKMYDLKLSTAVTYCYDTDRYQFWTYNTQGDLLKFLNESFVIGYGSLTYDCPLLMGEKHSLDPAGNSSNGEYSWTNYDILHETKKKLYAVPKEASISQTYDIFRKNFNQNMKGALSLNGVVKGTLNVVNQNGDAVELFKSKQILSLVEYNLSIVRSIKQLYDFCKLRKYLVTGTYDIITFNL